MISKDDLDAIQKELYPIINLQKKLLNINENEIKSIEEIVSEQTVDKISLRRLLSVLSSLIYARPLKLYRTALHEASSKGFVKIIKILLNREDVNYKKTDRYGALIYYF